jgi:hypothetical protein
MTFNTFGVVGVCNFGFGSVYCSLEFQGESIFFRQMAGCTVFLYFFQGLRMKVMRKFYAGALQSAVGLQHINDDNIRSFGIGLLVLTIQAVCTNPQNGYNEKDNWQNNPGSE